MKTTNIRRSWQMLTFIIIVIETVSGTEDPNFMFSCERPNWRNTTTFNRRYPTHLTLLYRPNNVYEGQSVTLCCCSKSMAKYMEIWWTMHSSVLSSKYDTNVLCHKIMNVSRKDSGHYRCFADNRNGITNDDVIIEVFYPPDILDQHIYVTRTDIPHTLQCLADGVPANYTYGQWDHMSYFGEHIRYLNSTADGRVILPKITNASNRYQDSGIYICTVSNGVIDRNGNSFQNGKVFFISNGPPVFVTKIEQIQYDHPGKIFNLEFIVYTKSGIKSYNVNCNNKNTPAFMMMTSVNRSMIFHGTIINVEAIEVVFRFKTSAISYCHNCTVTLCNGYGNKSFVVDFELIPKHAVDGKKINTKIAVIIVLAFLLVCVVISGIAIYMKRKRNMRPKGNSAPEGYPLTVNHSRNNEEQSSDSLTGEIKIANVVFQTCTPKTIQANSVANRTGYTDTIDSEKAVHFDDSQRVISSNETGYSDVWC